MTEDYNYYDCHEHCLYGRRCRIMRMMDNNPCNCHEFDYWDHLDGDDDRDYREDERE